MVSKVGIEKPWSFQIELTFGCNRRCKTCGINGLPLGRDEYHFMEPELAELIAKTESDLAPRARVEFAMRGEPLLNPRWEECVRSFRKHFPNSSLMMTTNGLVLRGKWEEYSARLYDAGINIVVLDIYRPYGEALRQEVEARPGPWDTKDFYAEGFSCWSNHGSKIHTLVFMDDLYYRAFEKRQRPVFNHGGNSPMGKQITEPLEKTCAITFREMSAHYDGSVSLCCHDFGQEYEVGDLSEQTASEIWYGKPWMAARRILQDRKRWMSPCCRCDVPSGFRVGFLPKVEDAGPDDFAIAIKTNIRSTRFNGRQPEWKGPKVLMERSCCECKL